MQPFHVGQDVNQSLFFKGSGPADPPKTDDFSENVIELARMNVHSVKIYNQRSVKPHCAPLTHCELLSLQREKSIPVFLPAKPRKECKRGRQLCAERWAHGPLGHLNPNQSTPPFTTSQQNLQDATARHDELTDSNGACSSARSQVFSHRKRENFKVHFDEIPKQVSPGSKEGNSLNSSGAERPLHLYKWAPCQPELESEEKKRHVGLNAHPMTIARGGSDLILADAPVDLHSSPVVLQDNASHLSVLPGPPAPSGLRLAVRRGQAAALTLLELQGSFSKSAAHRSYNRSITGATVNLRDSVATGRKHNFFGINCCYLRG